MSVLDDTLELARKGSDAAQKVASEARYGRQVFDTFEGLISRGAPPAPQAPSALAPAMSEKTTPGLVNPTLSRAVSWGVGLLAIGIIAVLAMRD